MKLEKLIQTRDALKALVAVDAQSPLDVDGDTRYDILANWRRARKATAIFDETREGLVKQHGVKGEDGNVSIPPMILVAETLEPNPKHALVKDELEKILERDVDDVTIKPIPLEKLKKSKVPIGLIDALIECGVITE